MTALYAWPKSAAFGRVIPKSRIYEHADVTTSVKALFVGQVDQIVWSHKLAPETINLTSSANVPEIQVFSLTLKTGELHDNLLRAIDRAIPFPIIFELSAQDRRRMVAAYKRPSDADGAKWVSSGYFSTDWLPEVSPRLPLPVALTLAGLYDSLLADLMPVMAKPGEDIRSRVERIEALDAARREVERIQLRLDREKQFNRRVAINAELRAAKTVLTGLDGVADNNI